MVFVHFLMDPNIINPSTVLSNQHRVPGINGLFLNILLKKEYIRIQSLNQLTASGKNGLLRIY